MTSLEASRGAGRGSRILIVDDDRLVRQIYADALSRQAGGACTLHLAEDGAAGLAALRERTFDCVLLDYRLPDMSGLDFLTSCAVEGRPPCAFVLITAQGSEAAAVEAMKRGVQDYLVKGLVDLGRLWDVTERAIGEFRLREKLAHATRMLEQRSTELVRLNESLARSEARFRSLVEAAPNALVVIDPDGRIDMVNAQTERLFGHGRLELLGAPADMLLPARLRSAPSALASCVPRTGPGAGPVERQPGLFGLRKDGREFEVEIRLGRIETEQGVLVLCAIVDVSARVEMEAELRQSQKMQAIGNVAAGVAHDFNNLLQALNGCLEMMLVHVADRPEASPWGEMALRVTQQAGELTGRLLSYSRKQILVARPVPVGALLGEVGSLIRHLFEIRPDERSELIVAPVSEGLMVQADPSQLQAALINLAVNAREAMPAGGRVRLSAYGAVADLSIVKTGYYTVIAVADTGMGMDAATIERACEPFFTTKGVGGTGLGLSMVQGFARQSGGEAMILSEVGKGTTVELWLPAPAPETTRPGGDAGTARGRVMLVDDTPDVLIIVRAFLRDAGFEVVACSSGELAVAELLGGRHFDALITDFGMPGMNGVDLVTRARQIDGALPVMIITGYYDPDILGGPAGTMVLRKPFSRSDLVEHVADLLGDRPWPAAEPAGPSGERQARPAGLALSEPTEAGS